MNTNNYDTVRYDDAIVRAFSWATAIWGIVGGLVGVIVASQLIFPALNFDLPFLTFGRLRPLHTNAMIFAFAGNAIFAGVYYSLQRLSKARLFSDKLSWLHFWGWQLIIVAAALTIPLGYTVSKEYAELEGPIDIAITLIWVVFAINFFGTLFKRREKHIYVAVWFYIASILAVAVLHIVNSLEIPVSLLKSYPVFAGVQDALVQWWYGHNAVAFFLTTPFLGLMYYFLPKAAEKPVYSYRLSVVHFWSLVFIYIWAGPHHLHYTALPDWAQSLGMVFSVMLWMPSWGGMLNGLLTLRGAWDKVRQEPVLKFLVASVTFYGMATFEGPLMSIKSVNALSHYTDWTIGHVHSGALGWNGFLTFGMLYWMMPRLYRTKLFSQSWANLHFWLGTSGIVLYVLSMWGSGVTQGLMLKALTPEGKLAYPEFMETVIAIQPFYYLRLLGGLLYFSGLVLGLLNLYKTSKMADARAMDEEVRVPARYEPATPEEEIEYISNATTLGQLGKRFHRFLEGKPLIFTGLTMVAVLIGGIVEIVPSLLIESTVPTIVGVKPYTPLEIHGRDLYIREGCYNCHSQMVRPFKDELLRYGEYSRPGEFVYDHPFQWGSRRIGPDLHRVGGKYPDLWHYRHMQKPQTMASTSIMPAYPWLISNKVDTKIIPAKINALKKIGVPYNDEDVKTAETQYQAQASQVAQRLKDQGQIEDVADKEIVAMIAYLQRLGMDFKDSKEAKR
ncbi:MAG: cytochrome-c oxidase, cbb3-type subunit I [Oligoflexia bacterium]|nr:cytochrome-c oxidase, cbb3-type subunit I [Oligoflexia bacterium]